MNSSSPRSSKNDYSANSAALTGASLAFQKTLATKSKPKPPTPSARSNGALVAATSVTRDSSHPASPSIRTPSRPSKQTAGSAAKEGEYFTDLGDVRSSSPSARRAGRRLGGQNNNSGTNGGSTTTTPAQPQLLTLAHSALDPKSPSFIAATLAASRSASPTPSPAAPSHPLQTPIRLRRKTSFGSQSVASSTAAAPESERPENDLICPTTALISMFEDKGNAGDPVKKSTPVAGAASPPKFMSPLQRRGGTPASVLASRSNFNISPIPAPRLGAKTPPSPPRHQSPNRHNESDMSLSVESKTRRRARPDNPSPARSIQSSPGSSSSSARREATFAAEPKAASRLSLSLDIKAPRPQRAVSKATITAYSAQLDTISGSDVETRAPPRPPSSASASSSNDTFVSASSTNSPTRTTAPASNPLASNSHLVLPTSSRSTTTARLQQQRQRASPSRPSTPGRTQSASTPGSVITPNYSTPASSTTTLPLPPMNDAMLASSLASVRAAQVPRSAATSPPPVPPARKHRHSLSSSFHRIKHHHSGSKWEPGSSSSSQFAKGLKYHHTGNSTSSLPAPPSPSVPGPYHQQQQQQRNMPMTLRANKTGEDKRDKDEARRQKKKAKGSKRHAHSEGARKRWRDQITAEERRRYEGLWASNKGLLVECLWSSSSSSTSTSLLPSIGAAAAGGGGRAGDRAGSSSGTTTTNAAGGQCPPPEECVLNVVVRDLWRRSRLPDDELGEVWDLVDRNGRGMLDRHEFVVGLWVVDQRLKGRKIPTRIQESVWDSARGLRTGKK